MNNNAGSRAMVNYLDQTSESLVYLWQQEMTPASRNPVYYYRQDQWSWLDCLGHEEEKFYKKLPQVNGETSRQETAWLMGDQSLAFDLYRHGKHSCIMPSQGMASPLSDLLFRPILDQKNWECTGTEINENPKTETI